MVLVVCFNECFSSCATTGMMLLLVHVCSSISDSASVRLLSAHRACTLELLERKVIKVIVDSERDFLSLIDETYIKLLRVQDLAEKWLDRIKL